MMDAGELQCAVYLQVKFVLIPSLRFRQIWPPRHRQPWTNPGLPSRKPVPAKLRTPRNKAECILPVQFPPERQRRQGGRAKHTQLLALTSAALGRKGWVRKQRCQECSVNGLLPCGRKHRGGEESLSPIR